MIPNDVKMQRVSVSIKKEILDRAKEEVRSGRERSLSALVTKAIHQYVEKGRN